MAAYVNMVLTSSPNHIKITSTLQNNHHSELPEIWLNGSPTTRELKKKPQQDWKEGWRCNGLVQYHVKSIKIGRNILAAEVPLKKEGSQLHTRPPSPGFQCQKEKSPYLLAVKISRY